MNYFTRERYLASVSKRANDDSLSAVAAHTVGGVRPASGLGYSFCLKAHSNDGTVSLKSQGRFPQGPKTTKENT
jgi:hypothetical protein